MRPIACCACGLLLASAPLAAQTTATSPDTAPLRIASASSSADTTALIPFDIPAQPLATALAEFVRQSGVTVKVDGKLGEDLRSATLLGAYTASEALRILLGASGYGARFSEADVCIVSRKRDGEPVAQTLGAMVVRADATRSAYTASRTTSATKTDTPLRDTPQAVTVIPSGLIADQAMRSMTDVVRYIPGITMGQGEGHRDAPTIRGNSSTADFFVDGVRDDAQYLRDLYNVDRVEALKGPNAMIFGRGGGGGVINRVLKEAQWSPVHELTLAGGSYDQRRVSLDVGQGLTRRFAARLNGVYENSSQFRDATSVERYGVNPTAALLLGSTMVRVEYEHFADDRTVDRGIPSFEGRPSNADITTFFGDPDASRSRVRVNSAGAELEHGTGAGVTVRNRTRFVAYEKFYQNVYPGALDATGENVSLSAYSNRHDRRNVFNQTDVTYGLHTGAVRHTLLVGTELGRQSTFNFRQTGYFANDATSITVPFANPTTSAPVTFRQSASDADNQVTTNVAAVYAQNQMAPASWIQLIAGVRYDRFMLRFANHRNDETLSRSDEMLSPRLGLVVKPMEPLSVYGTYAISHLPSSGDQFSSLTATTQTLEPERFTNREVGAKWDVHPALSLTAALYELDRTNTSAPDPVDPSRRVQTGSQRTKGWELGVAGSVTSAWQVSGGWAVQQATITSRTSSAAEGKTVPLVPHHTLSLWNRYQLVRRLGLGLGVVHQAESYAAIDNAVTLPAFTRVDAAAFLALTPSVQLQLNVENLLDERYYGTSHGNNNILPGAPRTLRLTAAVRK